MHLQEEESFMRLYGYPKLQEHIEQHRQYRRDVALLCLAVVKKEEEAQTRLCKFLAEWWEHHIQTEDRAYGQFFIELGVAPC